MNETQRDSYLVRRDEVLGRVPDEIDRSATGLAAYFGISRAVAWRMFLSPDGHVLTRDSVSLGRVCATFPDATFDQLFDIVDRDPARVAS